MKKDASSPQRVGGPFKFIRTTIHNIFNYLTCNEYNEYDLSDNRRLLRNLYNAGHIDEGKYHHFRERCSNDNFDPEEIHEA
jgi:hypothetical protein